MSHTVIDRPRALRPTPLHLYLIKFKNCQQLLNYSKGYHTSATANIDKIINFTYPYKRSHFRSFQLFCWFHYLFIRAKDEFDVGSP